MHLTIITRLHMIGLGMLAKNIFLDHVLWPDPEGQFHSIQKFSSDMLIGAMKMPLESGITQEIKNGIIDALADLKEGERFIVAHTWIEDPKSEEAEFHRVVVSLLNKSIAVTLPEAVKEANEIIRKARSITGSTL